MRGSAIADDTLAERSTKRRTSKYKHIKGDNAMSDRKPRIANGKLGNNLECTTRRRLDTWKRPFARMSMFWYGSRVNKRSENVPLSSSDSVQDCRKMFNSASASVYVMTLNSGIGGSLDNTRWRDRMSDWAVAGSKVHESFVILREGMKMARQKAGSDRDESENIPEAICESVMP